MATLVMIESWLQSTGQMLPPLLRRLGHEFVLVTRDPGIYGTGPDGREHPARRFAADVVVAETNDPASLADRVADLAARRSVDGVLTTCDYYLPAAAIVAERLGLPGPSPDVMAGALAKHEVRAALDRAGVPNARFAVADGWPAALDAAGGLGYPLVAKPVDLNAGSNVRLVESDAHLKDAVADITTARHNTRGQALHRLVLLEEVIIGTEVSVEAITVDGRTTVLGITDKSVAGRPAFIESGHMFPAALPPPVTAAVEAFVADVLAAVGFTHGVSHTEVMVTADGPRLVELNPRQGGGHIFDLVRTVTGTNPLRLLVELALGAPSQVGTAGTPLPDAPAAGGSAAVVFVVAPHAGEVVAVDGLDRLAADPRVVGWTLPVPARAPQPVDNEAYLGRIMTVDPAGPGARARAEALAGTLRLRFADGTAVAPLGFPSGLV